MLLKCVQNIIGAEKSLRACFPGLSSCLLIRSNVAGCECVERQGAELAVMLCTCTVHPEGLAVTGSLVLLFAGPAAFTTHCSGRRGSALAGLESYAALTVSWSKTRTMHMLGRGSRWQRR